MIAMAHQDTDTSDPRLGRLIEIVSLASVGEYAAATARFADITPDEFGLLEESLRIFVQELEGITTSRQQALDEVTRAKEQLATKLAVIEDQQRAIHELLGPVLDVWDGVLAVPLVGRIERSGALALTEKLLAAVVARRSRWALLDLTGVDEIDVDTAACLIDLTRAVGLVGARCILTGVSPVAAACLVEHSQGLGGVHCLANLREGLRHCLTHGA